MPKFIREKIGLKVIEKAMSKAHLAALAGVTRQTVYRALEGHELRPQVISKICSVLGIDPAEYLDLDRPKAITKKVTIARADGDQKEMDVTAFFDANGQRIGAAAWCDDDEDFNKAIRAYFHRPVEIEGFSTHDQIVKKISGSSAKEVAEAVEAEIRTAENQGFYLDTIGVAPDGQKLTLLLFKKKE